MKNSEILPSIWRDWAWRRGAWTAEQRLESEREIPRTAPADSPAPERSLRRLAAAGSRNTRSKSEFFCAFRALLDKSKQNRGIFRKEIETYEKKAGGGVDECGYLVGMDGDDGGDKRFDASWDRH